MLADEERRHDGIILVVFESIGLEVAIGDLYRGRDVAVGEGGLSLIYDYCCFGFDTERLYIPLSLFSENLTNLRCFRH